MSNESENEEKVPKVLHQTLLFDCYTSVPNISGLMERYLNDTYHNWVGYNKETDENLNRMIRYYSLMNFLHGIKHESAKALVEGTATYDVVQDGDGLTVLRIYDKRLGDEILSTDTTSN